MREFRFAVGSREGARSAVWKCWVQGDEVYLTGHLFGAEAKVSLHSSGVCQWSLTNSWVKKDVSRRNADRHIVRWNLELPEGSTSKLAFRVAIPVSELRRWPLPEGQKEAYWVGGAPIGSTVEFCFYVTSVLDGQPKTDTNPALRHLASLPLRNGRWLVCFVWQRSLSAADIAEARAAAVAQAIKAEVQVHPEHRIALFASATNYNSAAVMEVCATAA